MVKVTKILLIIFDGLTKEDCIAMHLFVTDVFRLGKSSGWLFTSLYLKQCTSSLTTACGGEKALPAAFPVSLSRGGVPTYHSPTRSINDVQKKG